MRADAAEGPVVGGLTKGDTNLAAAWFGAFVYEVHPLEPPPGLGAKAPTLQPE